ncbi:hypothetical protein I3843_15G077200 [Carya illinoinensis]|uniref:Uncharacterized protein n=1 Tax=Carya illinoinensis TaxID=32201 RepID=A0A8T1NCX9_CARIL|nr:hypothetical protein CIPAW_15G085300 [Carya illinoinensis]KAG6675074.1 hypothetical protein I3842_15G081800 [Carya illinoinensis]KAG7944036.1 hypothetical protein I3843_15G077200 [Carya illinoinensis]
MEGKGSPLVYTLLVVLSILAFGFAFAARGRKFTSRVVEDPRTDSTYCLYDPDVATFYGVAAFLFLLSSQSLLMSVTRCMCFARTLPRTFGKRAWPTIYLVSSWVTFLVAEACLIAGAFRNAYHTKYWSTISVQDISCVTLRQGVFLAGALFAVATMINNVYYYLYFSMATTAQVSNKYNGAYPTVEMTGHV